jgi:hypothetical protein
MSGGGWQCGLEFAGCQDLRQQGANESVKRNSGDDEGVDHERQLQCAGRVITRQVGRTTTI